MNLPSRIYSPLHSRSAIPGGVRRSLRAKADIYILTNFAPLRLKLRGAELLCNSEPTVGIEPTTCCLQNSCSTTELSRPELTGSRSSKPNFNKFGKILLGQNSCSTTELSRRKCNFTKIKIKWEIITFALYLIQNTLYLLPK